MNQYNRLAIDYLKSKPNVYITHKLSTVGLCLESRKIQFPLTVAGHIRTSTSEYNLRISNLVSDQLYAQRYGLENLFN